MAEQNENLEEEKVENQIENVDNQPSQNQEIENKEENIENSNKVKEEPKQAKEEPKEISEEDFLDKIVAKRNKKKRIAFSITMALTLILAAIIIAFACIKVNVEPYFVAQAQSSTFEVHYNSNVRPIDNSDERFDKIDKAYHNAFKMSYLTSIFTGTDSRYEIVEDSRASSYITEHVGDNYLKIRLTERIILMNADKTQYQSINYSLAKKLTFDEVYITLPTENEFCEITIAFPIYGAYVTPNHEVDENVATMAYIKVKANIYDLTKTIIDLFELDSEE